jgi:hypothetical protein
MTVNRINICILFFFLLSVTMAAQENSISPYSVFGIGDIQLGESGRTTGMASTSISLSGRHFLNTANPAALTGLDSTTFIFDIMGSARSSTFTSGNITERTFNANFTGITAGLRITSRWSGALSLQPFSIVSYKVEDEDYIEGSQTKTATLYEGAGGVTRFSVLNSFKLTQKLSLGADMMLLFGNINRDVSQSGITLSENSESTSFSFSLGILYNEKLSDNIIFSAGLIYGYRSNFLFDNSLEVTNGSGDIIFNDNIASSKINIPGCLGLGLSLAGKRMVMAADYHYQNWSVTGFKNSIYSLTDTHKFNCGLAFIPARGAAKSYLEMIEYQAGFSVSNSYLKFSNNNPVDLEFTTGVSLPSRKGGQINIGLSWGKKGKTDNDLIREDYLRLCLGISMVERMFLKRLYD